ncbi:MAG: YhdH/YhfP family quinone oxidoreductase [Steroidobacteraceae bacterium]
MNPFKAYRIHEHDGKIAAGFESMAVEALTPGDVVIRVKYSSINYKDALAATGAGRILRKYPLNGGIDLSGEVVSTTDDRFRVGMPVLVTGCGLSENIDGGYAEYARIAGDSVFELPMGIDLAQAMAIGTAGFTAALAIHRMEHNGQTPAKGAIVVTGASGGVGSIAVDLLAGRGYEVVAVSGKAEADDYLKSLGAARVLRRQEIDLGKRPMEATQWGGAIDNVGGELLTWLTRTVDFWGNIASIGLAGSHKLETTVLPFILRGINLLGINSSATPRDVRLVVWKRLATDLRPRSFDRIVTRTIPFDELPGAFDDFLKGRSLGRTVVKIA